MARRMKRATADRRGSLVLIVVAVIARSCMMRVRRAEERARAAGAVSAVSRLRQSASPSLRPSPFDLVKHDPPSTTSVPSREYALFRAAGGTRPNVKRIPHPRSGLRQLHHQQRGDPRDAEQVLAEDRSGERALAIDRVAAPAESHRAGTVRAPASRIGAAASDERGPGHPARPVPFDDLDDDGGERARP